MSFVLQLIVQATDLANTTMVSQRTVYVRVLDVNDNNPSFKKYGTLPNSPCPNSVRMLLFL
jgi:hypothetical protein